MKRYYVERVVVYTTEIEAASLEEAQQKLEKLGQESTGLVDNSVWDILQDEIEELDEEFSEDLDED